MATARRPQAPRPGAIVVPTFTPRRYQLPVLQAFERGTTRAILLWHRRAGKDTTGLGVTTSRMVERVGTYYHVFPTYNQGRKALWDGVDGEGRPFLAAFPGPLIAQRSEQEMQLTLRNGSIWQIVGADQPDRLRGTNPVGVVLSEYAVQNPTAWDILRPILAENGGWALFPYTPNGKNHGWDLWRAAHADPAWFTSRLTVDDTRRPDGTPVITPAAIEAERRNGMPEELIQQEFYCSFEAGVVGSYYGPQLAQARLEGRIAPFTWNPTLPVNVGWDLGIGDATALGCYQQLGREVRWLDYYEASGQGLEHYVRWLKERPYPYEAFDLPHDIEVREFTSGKSRKEVLQGFFPGVRLRVAAKLGIDEGIARARVLLARSWFATPKTDRLVDVLGSYRKRWDEKRRVFLDTPEHDWASHGADMVRTVAVAFEEAPDARPRQAYADPGDDPYARSRPRQLYAEA